MSQPDLRDELNKQPVEPLLPIEKKLIGWSLGLGVFLLSFSACSTTFCLPRCEAAASIGASQAAVR